MSGYAFAGGGRQVAQVDVSIDAGLSWTRADLALPPSEWAWRHWRAMIDLPAGGVRLVARAHDAAGATQPESPASVWNPKGYANNSWARLRVRCRE